MSQERDWNLKNTLRIYGDGELELASLLSDGTTVT
jgi:hypothetical protein